MALGIEYKLFTPVSIPEGMALGIEYKLFTPVSIPEGVDFCMHNRFSLQEVHAGHVFEAGTK